MWLLDTLWDLTKEIVVDNQEDILEFLFERAVGWYNGVG